MCRFEIPEELLILIFSFLDSLTLMTARLVCLTWRSASNGHLISVAPTRCSLSVTFVGLWSLSFVFRTGPDLTPTVHIRWPDERTTDVSCVAATAGLTFTALTFLSIPAYKGLCPAVSAMLKEPTALRALHLECPPSGWLLLLPHVWDLQHLRALGMVPLGDPEVLRHVSALTQLTGFWDEQDTVTYRSLVTAMAPLKALTALQMLSLNGSAWHSVSHMQAILDEVRPEELCSRIFRPTGSLLEDVIAPLVHLTALRVSDYRGRAFEWAVTGDRSPGPGPLGLRHLVWWCCARSCKAWDLPRTLEHLCVVPRDRTCSALGGACAC